ncbi:hypothetical protein GGQ22_19125 [Nocardioides sp. zg-579]|uniref:Uncharacterized protein n=1 Tax=Nocardioides marmotae TaxID=2663857 RepID=A0A6I3JFU4_9ACTN|nr:hypothetical protein [Nocardioides marmotae]MCR6033528.1 hypothetical protein [Gordonia jinghuaiqii]MTB97186.1 hypothetical protein [Nocardioides marmotae]QKE02105.1 hypothetical protein HPC71_14245 [Nocardioides marmotae]
MIVRVRYHREAGTVWADSPDVEGFVVTGSDLVEVRDLVREGLPFYLDTSDIDVREVLDESSAPVVQSSFGSELSILQLQGGSQAVGGVRKADLAVPHVRAPRGTLKTVSSTKVPATA